MKIPVFWAVRPCGLVSGYWCLIFKAMPGTSGATVTIRQSTGSNVLKTGSMHVPQRDVIRAMRVCFWSEE